MPFLYKKTDINSWETSIPQIFLRKPKPFFYYILWKGL